MGWFIGENVTKDSQETSLVFLWEGLALYLLIWRQWQLQRTQIWWKMKTVLSCTMVCAICIHMSKGNKRKIRIRVLYLSKHRCGYSGNPCERQLGDWRLHIIHFAECYINCIYYWAKKICKYYKRKTDFIFHVYRILKSALWLVASTKKRRRLLEEDYNFQYSKRDTSFIVAL